MPLLLYYDNNSVKYKFYIYISLFKVKLENEQCFKIVKKFVKEI